MEDVCGDGMRNLGGRLVLMLMREGILIGGVVVVSFSGGRCLPMVEVECVVVGCGLVGGDVLNFGGVFAVVMVVVEMVGGGSKLEVVAVVRIVWSCVNGELYSLRHLSRKSLEGKMSNGRLFGVMKCCLGEVTGSIEEMVVVEMIVGVVESVVLADACVIGGSYIGAADNLRMYVGDSDRGDGGTAVMGDGGACVGSGMVGERDYWRIPGVI